MKKTHREEPTVKCQGSSSGPDINDLRDRRAGPSWYEWKKELVDAGQSVETAANAIEEARTCETAQEFSSYLEEARRALNRALELMEEMR